MKLGHYKNRPLHGGRSRAVGVTWWPKNSQNPEIEHEHAQFWGGKVARQEEGPKTSADTHFWGGGGRQRVGKTPKMSGHTCFQGWGGAGGGDRNPKTIVFGVGAVSLGQ